jgi:CheY-like chemotaxis protein/cytidylate kinase
MPVIAIFSGIFCREDETIEQLAAATGFERIGDERIVAEAQRASGMAAEKFQRAFSGPPSVFNNFTHEKERALAFLRLALAEALMNDDLLLTGFCTHLAPPGISHILRTCLIADREFRIQVAAKKAGLSAKEAARAMRAADQEHAVWVSTVHGITDPWAANLYDLVIPLDKFSVAKAVGIIRENLLKKPVQVTGASRRAVKDLHLAAQVETALAREGHHVEVSAENGRITLRINKKVLLLNRLKSELESIVGKMPGVESVNIRVGRDFHQSDIYRKVDFEVPSRVLLVDDEREFAQTLSERLQIRDVGSAVTYDGQSALEMVEQDEPDVMILDLKMPGIDGLEVLRRVKQSRPHIEVIVLTGHGSEADREKCMQLGAFAYLQKPVDIDLLSKTLRQAHEKVRRALRE